MIDEKISQLNPKLKLDPTDLIPIVDNSQIPGVTERISVSILDDRYFPLEFTIPISGLILDGRLNWLSLGTLGNLGSMLANGFFFQFDICTTCQDAVIWGTQDGVNQSNIRIEFNQIFNGSIGLRVGDAHSVIPYIYAYTSSPTNFNDGKYHRIQLNCNTVNKTQSIIVDYANQPITYNLQQTLATFINFNHNFDIGALSYFGSDNIGGYCFVSNIKIGTSKDILYGNYPLKDGQGTVATDMSGNGNNGSLQGSPLPIWFNQ